MKTQRNHTIITLLTTILMLACGALASRAWRPVEASVVAPAATITVTNLNDSGPGSLRQAIAGATPGTTINFSVTGAITLTTGQLFLPGGLTIQGPGAGLLTVSGNGATTVFAMDSRSGADPIIISGLTIADGASVVGGVINGGASLTLDRVNIVNNTAAGGYGGGVYNSGETTILNSAISGNSAYRGGGVYNARTLNVFNTTISGNTAQFGGGIYFDPSLDSSVVNCTITGNRATTAVSGGGGVFYERPFDITLTNTLIAGNFAGAASEPNDIKPGAFSLPISASYCLIGDAASAGFNVDGVNGNIVGNQGSGTIDLNTVLDSALAFNGGPTGTHALVAGSPAINAGSNALAVGADGNPLPTDQRGLGFPRIAGGTVDIGAFELQATHQQQVAQIIAQVQELVAAGVLNSGQGQGLIAKLNGVIAKLNGGQTGAACNQLNAFKNQVNGFINAGILSPAQGQELIDAANAVRSGIGC